GKPLKPGNELDQALNEVSKDLMKSPPLPSIPKPPRFETERSNSPKVIQVASPLYPKDSKVATRQAIGDAFVALGKADSRIWSISADTSNSTYSDKFTKEFPDRSVECYIAEQNMAGIAAGLAARGLIPFVSTFGAFLARAFDQIRMTALSGLNVKYFGTHAGVSIGEDGPSQMALEDLAAFRTLQNSVVLYPSDAISAYACIVNMANYHGPAYIRLSRPATPLIYSPDEQFEIGDAKLVVSSNAPKLSIISAGVVLHEVLKAVKELNVDCLQVIDLYCLKPFPRAKLLKLLESSNGRCIVFEEHAAEGGVGESVASGLAGHIREWNHVAVSRIPRSGPPEEQLDSFGLSAKSIKEKIQKILG
ncbi:transketolase, partial [bacterium]|nr:transketolase [bacterium]